MPVGVLQEIVSTAGRGCRLNVGIKCLEKRYGQAASRFLGSLGSLYLHHNSLTSCSALLYVTFFGVLVSELAPTKEIMPRHVGGEERTALAVIAVAGLPKVPLNRLNVNIRFNCRNDICDRPSA